LSVALDELDSWREIELFTPRFQEIEEDGAEECVIVACGK
jgi:hypothetical protein